MDTPSITRREFDHWLHNRDKTDREEEISEAAPFEAQEETRNCIGDSIRFPWPFLERQIRKSRPTLKELFTVRKAIGMIRIMGVFVFGFATINVAIVILTERYGVSSMLSFLRFGMTVPASLCAMCNATGIFLLSHLVEKLYLRKGDNGPS